MGWLLDEVSWNTGKGKVPQCCATGKRWDRTRRFDGPLGLLGLGHGSTGTGASLECVVVSQPTESDSELQKY